MANIKQHKNFFGKVRIARELLREKAQDILLEYMDVVQRAKEAGDYETAAKALQWLLDHMPADEEGGRLVEQSVDKKQQIAEKSTGPSIRIGIAMGGLGQRSLPEPTKPGDAPIVEVVEND